MLAKLVVRHGESWTKIQTLNEDELNQRLSEANLSTEGDLEERQTRLWEHLLPVYPIPHQRIPTYARVIFSAVLDEDNEPRAEGADRAALVGELQDLGFPDDQTANQAVDQQIENLVLYYGYRQVSTSADVIVMEKR